MTESAHDAVVVGFDGSTLARQAAHWAAREAATRRRRLVIVHAFRWPLTELSQLRTETVLISEEPFRTEYQRMLDSLVEECRSLVHGLDVHGSIVTGEPVDILERMAASANLLVLGSSGHGTVHNVLLGSTSSELVRHANAPVVVIRETDDPSAHRKVVVGVDGSPTSAGAVDFAYDYATRHNAELVAVHAWSDLPLDALGAVREWDVDWDEITEQARVVLSETLSGHSARYPDVRVRQVVTMTKPVEGLLAEAADADLVVVGSHGRGAVRRMLLGSVSQAILHYATCPVAVIRAPEPSGP